MELERAFSYDGQHSLVRQLQANTGYRVTFQDFAMFLINNCFANVPWNNFRYSLQKVHPFVIPNVNQCSVQLLELSSMNSTGWGGLDQQVNRVFDILDTNRSGTLEVQEFGQLSNILQQQCVPPPCVHLCCTWCGHCNSHDHALCAGGMMDPFSKCSSTMVEGSSVILSRILCSKF